MSNLHIINPIDYPGWDELLLEANGASFFHCSAWASVLHESYGYQPIYFGSVENGKLNALMPFMEINSWVTGKRGVSLPFTDRCPAVAPDSSHFEAIVNNVINYGENMGWKYIEWRDDEHFAEEINASDFYYEHQLSLAKTEEELFSRLRSNTRRNIKKAIRSGVQIEFGHSLDAVEDFYKLNCITRKRHGIPPQPGEFFKKVYERVIAKGYGCVISALYAGKIISSSVFLHFGKRALYKYGASDLIYQDVRAANLVMWEAIKWYRDKGFQDLNLGRTEPDNKGLLQYKRGWGGEERVLRYYKYDVKKKTFTEHRLNMAGFARRIFAKTPVPILNLLGRLLYKHVG
jgi:hypothetical protein